MNSYGKELILDLHDCDLSTFTRTSIRLYFINLCELIDMERRDLHFWDYEGDPKGYEEAEDHLKGISAVQFISTSNITIHTIDVMRNVHLNIFSCKDFEENIVKTFTENWFKGKVLQVKSFDRLKEPNIEIRKMNGFYFLWINDHLWMYDILPERKCQKEIADRASGDVLCAGYGLGLVQKYLLQNPKVKSIVTIEKYLKVIELNETMFGELFGDILVADFFHLRRNDWIKAINKKFDCIIGDIWPDILPEYLPDYLAFEAKAKEFLKPDGEVLVWGKDYFEFLRNQ